MSKKEKKQKNIETQDNAPKQNIFQRFKAWFRRSSFIAKVEVFFKKAWQYVLFGLECLLPIKHVRKLTYDRLRHDQQKVVVSLIFLLPVMFGFCLFFLYPLVRSLIMSFGTVEILKTGGIHIHFGEFFLKTGTGGAYNFNDPDPAAKNIFYNYIQAFTASSVDFPVGLATTAWNTIVDTAVITIFSLLVAVMLNGNFKGRAIVRAIFFLPVVFNSEAITAALNAAEGVGEMLNKNGNNALAELFDLAKFMQGLGVPVKLVTFLTDITSAIYRTISYSGIQILVFLTAIQSVPKHLYEAATIEGATGYEQFWKITLPMVSPMIVTVVVYTIVDSFLRSEICDIMDIVYRDNEYGYYAAMSWIYILASLLIMGIVVGILSKVVFYYDDKK